MQLTAALAIPHHEDSPGLENPKYAQPQEAGDRHGDDFPKKEKILKNCTMKM
jgi:hypothetical protein